MGRLSSLPLAAATKRWRTWAEVRRRNAEQGVYIAAYGAFEVIEREHRNLLEKAGRTLVRSSSRDDRESGVGPGVDPPVARRVRIGDLDGVHHERALHWRFLLADPRLRRRDDLRRREVYADGRAGLVALRALDPQRRTERVAAGP
ncbi:MAG: hypothetical protein HS123_16110 [Solibacteraceae bacterium]|nr:hypothetical protein [Solibacteraceae bacterium]